jgi:lysophospholipase L1-like esterase
MKPRPQGGPKTGPYAALIVFVSLIIFVGSDLLLTWGMREWHQFNRDSHQQKMRSLRVPSPTYHHDLAANQDFVDRWGPLPFRVITNSLGFRDISQRVVPLKSKDQRILFIGDSFTEGVGLPYERTFTGLVANQLQSQNIEVLNAGVSSYFPWIYYRKIKYVLDRGLEISDVVVFLDISDIQDEVLRVRPIALKHTQDSESPRTQFLILNWLEAHTTFYPYIKKLYALSFGDKDPGALDQSIIHPAVRDRSYWTFDNELYTSYAKEGLELSAQSMDQLAKILKEQNIKLTLVVYPWPGQILHRDLNSIHVQHWQRWAKDHQARFIDLFPTFIGPLRATEVIEKYFLPDSIHWNAEGHQLVAEKILESLK